MADDPLLAVDDLRVDFETDRGSVRAVDGASFGVGRGEILCVVGESGSGKTVAAEAVTRLVEPEGRIAGGDVRVAGESVLGMDDAELQSLRGGVVGHVFQHPDQSLNPVYTVGSQVVEAIRLHDDVGRSAARDRAIDLLDRVGLPAPASRFDDYPHELSGGQKQRVAIAVAIAARPALVVADEPTASLDVTVQAGVLSLLDDLREEFGVGVLLVTHDLGVVAEVADRVAVMYAGTVMERGPADELFDHPAHPYTRALFACRSGRGGVGESIPGSPPDRADTPDGCRFHPRCDHAVDACRTGDQPPFHDVDATGRDVSCVYYSPGYDFGDPLHGDWTDAVDAGRDDREGPGA